MNEKQKKIHEGLFLVSESGQDSSQCENANGLLCVNKYLRRVNESERARDYRRRVRCPYDVPWRRLQHCWNPLPQPEKRNSKRLSSSCDWNCAAKRDIYHRNDSRARRIPYLARHAS